LLEQPVVDEIDRARGALHALDPHCSRETWVRIGMAAKAAGLSPADFAAWSSAAPNYADEVDCSRMWKSISTDGGVTAASLYGMAFAAGWQDPARTRPNGSKTRALVASAFQPIRLEKAPRRADIAAADVWKRLEAATAEHAYIKAKDGVPDGLRVVPDGDPLTIAGESVAGWLAVPIFPIGASSTEPVSIQFIPPLGTGKKLNLPGAPIAGVFVVGKFLNGATAHLCEGIGQAWACWKATGRPAVVCFGWGRIRAVAIELRARDPAGRLVIVPDVGKESDAETIAREAQGQFVTMPDGWEKNADVNDYALRVGFDALENLLSRPREPKQRFRLLGADDLRALPPLAWRVRGLLPALGFASIFGPSGSGKSFLALDLAACLAEGRAWFGYRVKACPVVYVVLEGEAGFRLRVAAWERANGRRLPGALRMVLQAFKLTDAQDVCDMVAAVRAAGPAAVTIVDTLNRAAPGADENSSVDMGRIVEAAKELQTSIAGLVLVVHHTGKDASKGMRGHSSLNAALDAALEITRSGDRREWSVFKSKDGQDGATHSFRLKTVELDPDEDGERTSSCVVWADEDGADRRRVIPPKSGNQRVVWDALGELLRKAGTHRPEGAPDSLPVGRPVMKVDEAVAAIRERLACDAKRKTERAQQALTGLQAKGLIAIGRGYVWVA
jgi:AAA domain-containing protein/primase-like protein